MARLIKVRRANTRSRKPLGGVLKPRAREATARTPSASKAFGLKEGLALGSQFAAGMKAAKATAQARQNARVAKTGRQLAKTIRR